MKQLFLLLLLAVSLAAGAVIREYENGWQNDYDDLNDDYDWDDASLNNDDQFTEDDTLIEENNSYDENNCGDNREDTSNGIDNEDYDDQQERYENQDIVSNPGIDDEDLSELETSVNTARKKQHGLRKDRQRSAKGGLDSSVLHNGISKQTENQLKDDDEERAKMEKNREEEVETMDNAGKKEATLDKIIKVNEKADVDLPEGDIKMWTKMKISNKNGKRNAVRDRRYLWLDRKIPYEFENSISEISKSAILEAINEFNNRTCIRFVAYDKKDPDVTRLSFFKGTGCWSFIGKSDSIAKQQVSIGEGCEEKGIVMHELMHAVGFFHEQSRSDRDKYIEILWENIMPGTDGNFAKQSEETITGLDLPYDYDGLMHYGERAFSKNGKLTIRALNRDSQQLGQNIGFSEIDLMQLKKLYACEATEPGWSPWSSYGPCTNDCFKTRQRVCFHQNYLSCNGSDSTRLKHDIVKCTAEECKRDGHWGRWSSWSTCSAKCHYGTHVRTRVCNDPEPRLGAPCTGADTQNNTCFSGPCNLGPNDCTFENGTCIWHDVPNAIKWIRHRFGTFTKDTGPPGDHTLEGEGYYMYMEASDVAPGDKALLVSKQLAATAKTCLSFWYNMNGQDMGTLTLTLKTAAATKVLVKIAGNQGDLWKNKTVEFSANSSYNLTFTAERGASPLSDIAIDDVLFRNGECVTQTTQSPQIQTTKELGTTQTTSQATGSKESSGFTGTSSKMLATSPTSNTLNGTLSPQQGNGGGYGSIKESNPVLIIGSLTLLIVSANL